MGSVTVVIPAHNAARFIGDALASVAQQTLPAVRVVVVDDGSTDDTLQVVSRFSCELDLEILRQSNRGPAAARNAGIRKTSSDYCAFLDADDVMLPDRLAAQAALLDASRNLGLVHSDLMTFDERGVIHQTKKAFSRPCGGQVLHALLVDNFITTSTVMAPTERVFDAGLFDESRGLSEDFELWLRIAARSSIGYIDRPLVKYRKRGGSLSADKLRTACCALDVVQTFWRENSSYLATHRATFRRSIANHLATAGSAAMMQGRRVSAAGYLVRALARDPWHGGAWKDLTKTLAWVRG